MVRKASNTDPNKRPVKYIPKKPLRYTEEQMVEALKRNHGRVYDTAKDLDCSPQTVANYMKRFPRLKKISKACRQTAFQGVVDKMFQMALDGNEKCIKFVLVYTPESRKRGYGIQPRIIDPNQPLTVGKMDAKVFSGDVATKILDQVKQRIAQQKALEQGETPTPQVGLKELPPGARVEVIEVNLDGGSAGQHLA